MMDDRMAPENLKSVAASIMNQQPGGDRRLIREATVADDSSSHPDAPFARNLFRGTSNDDDLYESPAPASLRASSLDLTPLARIGGPSRTVLARLPEAAPHVSGRKALREDLVQQAAQALVKDQIDAFLAITGKMSPDEIGLTLATARQWRRPDDEWQTSFQSAPETEFKFIDRKKPTGQKPEASKRPGVHGKPRSLTSSRNQAESLAVSVAEMMRSSKIPAEEAPRVLRRILNDKGVKIPERMFGPFANRIAEMV